MDKYCRSSCLRSLYGTDQVTLPYFEVKIDKTLSFAYPQPDKVTPRSRSMNEKRLLQLAHTLQETFVTNTAVTNSSLLEQIVALVRATRNKSVFCSRREKDSSASVL